MYEQGKYCPTTCGVADYMFRYLPGVSEDLTAMQDQLEKIANLTGGADEKITYMKDSTTSAQKSSQPGNIYLYFGLQFVILLSTCVLWLISCFYYRHDSVSCCFVNNLNHLTFYFRSILQEVLQHAGWCFAFWKDNTFTRTANDVSYW